MEKAELRKKTKKNKADDLDRWINFAITSTEDQQNNHEHLTRESSAQCMLAIPYLVAWVS